MTERVLSERESSGAGGAEVAQEAAPREERETRSLGAGHGGPSETPERAASIAVDLDWGKGARGRVRTNYKMSDSEDEAASERAGRRSRVLSALMGGLEKDARTKSTEGPGPGLITLSFSGPKQCGSPLEGEGKGGACLASVHMAVGGGQEPPNRTEALLMEESPVAAHGLDDSPVKCDVCGNSENKELQMHCDGERCITARHIYCHSEEMTEAPSEGWYCSDCEEGGRKEVCSDLETTEGESSEGSVSLRKAGKGGGGKREPVIVQGQPKCKDPGCSRIAYFGFKTGRVVVRERCGYHREDGMLRRQGYVCNFPGCHTSGHYGDPTCRESVFCVKHKEGGMLLLYQERRLSDAGCN
jgi:hypothetical protein